MAETQTATQPRAQLAVIRVRWEADPDGARMFPDEDHGIDYYGCTAVAEVSYACGGAGERRLEYLTSGGLWGIGDPSPAYRRQVEDEQIADLLAHLAVFAVEGLEGCAVEGRTRV